MLEIDNHRDYPEEEMKPAGQSTPLADVTEVSLGVFPNPVEGNVSMRARELDAVTREGFAGFFIARLGEVEEDYAQHCGVKKLPDSFSFTVTDEATEVFIAGNDEADAGFLRQKRTVYIRPFLTEEWKEKMIIERSVTDRTLPDGERGVNNFSYISPSEYRLTPHGERVPLENSAYTVRRIDDALDMVDDIVGTLKRSRPKKVDSQQPQIPPRVGLIPTPHGETAEMWLKTVARRIPLLEEEVVDEEAIVTARLAESEMQLSKETINRFSSHFLTRLGAVVARTPQRYFSSDGTAAYYTNTKAIFEVTADDTARTDGQGNVVQYLNSEWGIRSTPVGEGESVSDTMARIMEEGDNYAWEVEVAVQNETDGKSNIGYFDADEEFCWSDEKNPDVSAIKLPLFNTPRAVKLTDQMIGRLERIMGIAA